MYIAFYLVLGLALAGIYLLYSRRLSPSAELRSLSTVLIVASAIYVVFALFKGNMLWTGLETLGMAIYGLFVYFGFRYSILWLASGWALHPAWDVFLHFFGPGQHIAPDWYVIACISFDILVAMYIVVKAPKFLTAASSNRH